MKKSNKNLKNNDWIKVFGAREHNLKNIDVAVPKNELTIITGPSGSGKSTLALDILYTEGKRRYTESLSAYARQFLGVARKPDFDSIQGLCPSVAIEQKTVSSNPRSTVGTTTEIYDYLRVLFARVGQPHCPECFAEIKAENPQNITQMMLKNFKDKRIVISAPIAVQKKGEFVIEMVELFNKGFYRFLIDGEQHKFKTVDQIKALGLKKTFKHDIDVLLDMLDANLEEKNRLHEAVERSFALTGGVCKISVGPVNFLYSSSKTCLNCAISFPELEPRLFSFNSPIGACKECNGLGMFHEWPWQEGDENYWKTRYPDFFGPRYAREIICKKCDGQRLDKIPLAVEVGEKNIYELCAMSTKDLLKFFQNLVLPEKEQEISSPLVKEIISRLTFLNNVGLSYLSLSRTSGTLSGGESQRIRLATQIGSALSGVLYVLDEPSIGLHQRDNDRLIETLKSLRDQGNTVLVVEHDLDTMEQSDYLIDMGPMAGVLGGQVVACGTPQEVAQNKSSLTGAYLSGRRSILVPKKRRVFKEKLFLENARKNNLKNLNVEIPLGVLCGISGVSGSGKSSLVMQVLVPAIERDFEGKKKANLDPKVKGTEHLETMVVIDQSPIGRTPRSNPATYLGVLDEIRKLFASLPESNARGYKVGQFSFNVKDGRCAECDGDGVITVSMQFLADVTMQCKTCDGKRYSSDTLDIKYRGKNIADVLDMTAFEALEFFQAHTRIAKRLKLMCDVGLDYVKLGQASTTLSGGEAQRIKLVDELAKRGRNTLYILDEPTTGLHNSDIERLLEVLNTLVDKGNSMIVIEHNIDVLKTVDYLIDLGPEGGDGGGQIVAQGTPEVVAQTEGSHTGRYLQKVLNR
ncbi:MAG: UvrABC system protein A [candidate division TM6 bacterium GW2011_GWF2_32_72]|nr:MAG: UvrABC system protein A [candidate division TM6 bacterium GW2011_GWF2_32_72]